MGHQDAGHYAMKHSDKTINPKIAALLEKEAVNRTITCKSLHDIAENLGVKTFSYSRIARAAIEE